MSGIYFRRWTRMYLKPAIKYFQRYGVLESGSQPFLHLQNIEDPKPQNKPYLKRMARIYNEQDQTDKKLINALFLKYPDLKYETVNHQKYSQDFNSYSYAYAFISEQKKLMKAGYKTKKAFEMVEEKFQEKMKRKMDQTLLSKGLAIGNRARSFLTVYQQQVEYQSRLKMMRTQRQVLKYEDQLDQIKNAVQSNEGQYSDEYYERMFEKITSQSSEELNSEFKEEKRYDMVNRLSKDFSNTFDQFYERAAYRDRLAGLTDEEIKEQIMISPQKIKRQTRQLMRFLKKRGDISINGKGEIRVSDGLSDKMKSFIFSSPIVKIAILNDLMSYENPRNPMNRANQSDIENKIKLKHMKSIREDKNLTDQQKKAIMEKKLKEYEQVVLGDIPGEYSRTYRILESAEERMFRLEIKYYRSLLSEESSIETFEHLKEVVNKFRRLKFRMEKRYQKNAADDMAFPEHYELGNWAQIEKDAEYEELLQYLRKKVEERRLKAMDQVDDDKINTMIQQRALPEIPQSQGDKNKT